MAFLKKTPFTIPLVIALAGLLVLQYFTSASDSFAPSESKLAIQQFTFVPGTVIRRDSKFPITSEGAAGANVTWDFSKLAFSNTEFSFTAQDTATIPGSERFPNATAGYSMVMADGSSGYCLIDYKAGFTELGEILNGAEGEVFIYYSDPVTHCTTPITLGRRGSDNFAFSSTAKGRESNTTGIISWKVDAYGTLKLPNAMYTDVLRVRTMENGITTSGLSGSLITTESQEESWKWFKAGYPLPLLSYSLISDEHGVEQGSAVAMISMVKPGKPE